MAYGIGANDVANAFATSVGSRTLTMKSAIAIAVVSGQCQQAGSPGTPGRVYASRPGEPAGSRQS